MAIPPPKVMTPTLGKGEEQLSEKFCVHARITLILYIRTVPALRPRRCRLSPFRRFHTAPSGRTVRLWPAPWPAGRYCLAGRARVCPNSRTAAGIPPAIPLGRSAPSAWLSAGPVWRLPARPATRRSCRARDVAMSAMSGGKEACPTLTPIPTTSHAALPSGEQGRTRSECRRAFCRAAPHHCTT